MYRILPKINCISSSQLIYSTILAKNTNIQFRSFYHILSSSSSSSLASSISIKKNNLLNFPTHSIRFSSNSTNGSIIDETITSTIIPSAPPAVSATTTTTTTYLDDPLATSTNFVYNHLGEPTFSSLGLGNSWWPSSWFQLGLEYLHVTLNLEWYFVMPLVAVILRSILLPAVVANRKTMMSMKDGSLMKYKNHMTDMTRAQADKDLIKLSLMGNQMKGVNMYKEIYQPILRMSGIVPQGMVLFGMFEGLKGMAELPVASLQNGGLWWFSDLTLPDPYLILPALTSLTLFLNIMKGAEGITVGPTQKWMLILFPAGAFWYIMNSPSALSLYWLTSNVFGFIFMLILKTDVVKKLVNLPEPPKFLEEEKGKKKKSFYQTYRESARESNLTNKFLKHERHDSERWESAGKGPIIPTFKTNPKLENASKDVKDKLRQAIASRK